MPTIADNAAEWAREQVGATYVYGAQGPRAFDCSGLVVAAFLRASKHKILLPHNTVQLRNQCPRIGGRSNLRVGDFCFYYGDRNIRDHWGGSYGDPTHVAIYIGHGLVVQATNEARGVESIGVGEYATPTSFGRCVRAQKAA